MLMVNVGSVADRSKAKRYVLDFICQVHVLCSDFVLHISRNCFTDQKEQYGFHLEEAKNNNNNLI